MTTNMEKKMIGAFYNLTEEVVPKLREDCTKLQHHSLDLQYDLDSREKNRTDFEEFLKAEIRRHASHPEELQAMYTCEHILDKFREKML